MQPTKWPPAISLFALLTLTATIILSCSEEPTPRSSVPSPTAAPLSPPPTGEATTESTPTPPPVGPVPCEEGMILPRNSLCYVPEPPPQSEHMFLNFGDLTLMIDESGGAALEGDGQIISTGSELKNWLTGELTNEISFGVNRDHFRSRPEEGCVIGEVEWITVSAVHNGDGSWTVKSLWQLNRVEEICASAPQVLGETTSDVAAAWTVEQAEALAEQIVGFFLRNKPTVRSEFRGVLTKRVRDNVKWILDGPQREGDDVQMEVTAHVWLEVEGRTFEVWVPFILTIREQSVVDWEINPARARVHE